MMEDNDERQPPSRTLQTSDTILHASEVVEHELKQA